MSNDIDELKSHVEKNDFHFQIIKQNLERVLAIVTKTKCAELSLNDDSKDISLIAILGLLEDVTSDFRSVYEIERLIESCK